MKHRAAGDRTVSNFIFTIVKVGKVKDSVLVVNKTNIQTRDWCLEVKKNESIFFSHWTFRLPSIFNITPPRTDVIP